MKINANNIDNYKLKLNIKKGSIDIDDNEYQFSLYSNT